ncbi:MAG: GyrI-like domain-containing protein [Kofleriaceae bacterium]|nr:GyrI-like domain-containing protein [Kofleriaceae bacterium]
MDSKPAVIQLIGGHALAIRARVPLASVSRFFDEAFAEIEEVAGRKISGPPFALYHSCDPSDLDVSAAMPTWSHVEGKGRVESIELAAGPAVKIEHVGKFEELGATYAVIEGWLADNERKTGGPRREVYLTMPMAPPSEQITIVIQPLEPVPAKQAAAQFERTTRQDERGAPISK